MRRSAVCCFPTTSPPPPFSSPPPPTSPPPPPPPPPQEWLQNLQQNKTQHQQKNCFLISLALYMTLKAQGLETVV